MKIQVVLILVTTSMLPLLTSLVAWGGTIAGVVEVSPGVCQVDVICHLSKHHRIILPCRKVVTDHKGA